MDCFANAKYLPGGVDTHCHLAIMEEKGLPVHHILSECTAAGMAQIIDVGVSADDLPSRRARFASCPIARFTTGVHPMNASSWSDPASTELLSNGVRTGAGVVVAIGETGLDWYRGRDSADAQIRAFEAQLHLASRLNLPVVIHNRDATDDVYQILRRITPPAGGVMHCFSASAEWVPRFVDLGFWISFAGNLTYPGATDLREAAQSVPADRLLAETDAPFLSPVPVRGKPNHPGYVAHTVCRLAEIRNTTVEALTESILANTNALFRFGPT